MAEKLHQDKPEAKPTKQPTKEQAPEAKDDNERYNVLYAQSQSNCSW